MTKPVRKAFIGRKLAEMAYIMKYTTNDKKYHSAKQLRTFLKAQ